MLNNASGCFIIRVVYKTVVTKVKSNIRNTVNAALFAAIIFVATRFLQVPAPFSGYVHLGDCFVILAGWVISPVYAFLAAGIGSALSDLFSPYAVYTPATFIIKGVMAAVVCKIFKLLCKKANRFVSSIASGICAGIIMIGGYYLFEGVLYGFVPSLANIPANAVQAVGGVIFSTLLYTVLNKSGIIKK